MCMLQSEDLINQGGLSALPRRQSVRTHLPIQETQVRSLGLDDPLEDEMATHSSFLAWEIPWTEELGGLQSKRLQRVGHS